MQKKSNRVAETINVPKVGDETAEAKMLSCFLRDPARAPKKWNKQTETINVLNVEVSSERASECTKEIEQTHRKHKLSFYGERDVGKTNNGELVT